MMEDIIIVGYGGHAKSIADCIERQKIYRIAGYTDLKKNESSYHYLGSDEMLEEIYNNGIKKAVVGIGYMGNGNLREKLYDRLKKIGYILPVIIDPTAIISDTVKLSEGVFVGKGAIINVDAVVEKMAIINTRALIEHECYVGEYTHIAVGAVLCGQVKVGESCFVGANSTIIQQRKVDAYSIIPAGVTVR